MKKQIKVYLLLVFAVCFGLGILALIEGKGAEGTAYQILQKGFTLVPVLAAVITRRVLKSKESFHLDLHVWKDMKMWMFCAFVPSILISAGAVLYFLIFPDMLSGKFALGRLLTVFGTKSSAVMTVNPIRFILVTILIAAFIIPLQLFELGEEIGWRGFLLPLQIKEHGIYKGVLLNGILWGVAHLPLIYFGFNYSNDNFGAPWTNMIMMIVVCIVIGTIESYVTIRTGNCMYAAIIHGAINFIGEVPIYFKVTQTNSLLGPNPTGVIGMSGLIIAAVILMFRLKSVKNRL